MSVSLPPWTAELASPVWRALGVAACEKRLGLSGFDQLSERADRGIWARLATEGVLGDAGMLRPFASLRSSEAERAYLVAPAFRPYVFRRLDEQGELDAVQKAALAFGADPARTAFACALYGGQLAALERALPELARRAARGVDADFAGALLFEAVSIGFDAEWLERVWGDLGLRLAEQALSDALVRLEPAETLYRWTITRVDSESRVGLRFVLAEHALLRGEVPLARDLLSALSSRDQAGFRAALGYVAGDRTSAERALDDYERLDGSAHGAASVTALLVLLALSRGGSESAKLARRCLPRRTSMREPAFANWPVGSAEPDVSRALRALSKRTAQPESERARLSAHQMPASAPPWETVVNALSVLLCERDVIARAGWARRWQARASAPKLRGTSGSRGRRATSRAHFRAICPSFPSFRHANRVSSCWRICWRRSRNGAERSAR